MNTPNPDSGRRYEHPVGICPSCGTKQPIYRKRIGTHTFDGQRTCDGTGLAPAQLDGPVEDR